MLDFNHVLATPGLDVQYFTGQGGYFGLVITSAVLNLNITAVTIADTAGTLTVTANDYRVGQPITVSGTLSAGTINGTANYTTPVTFYIITVNSSTSIVISSTLGGAAVTSTTGTATTGGVFSLNGTITINAGVNPQVGQAIVVSGTLSAGTISGTANYTTPVTFYIVSVSSATVITISATFGGVPVLSTAGTATTGGVFTSLNSGYQTWRKPRGVKNVYILTVGGGSSGAVGPNNAAATTGGSGGGSGGQSCVWIPALFVPDVLYIQCGSGGRHPTTLYSGGLQVGGGPSYVLLEPSTTVTANLTLLYANGGTAGATGGGIIATIANMPLAARGLYTLIAGAAGAASVSTGIGTSAGTSLTGLIPTGGGGGGGAGNAGGSILMLDGLESNIIPSISGGAASGNGSSGFIDKYFLYSLGGSGGGGGANTNGGNGGPGAGGGGAGAFATTPGGRPGDGGPGFVIIMSW
jgi:hypothetical protein